MSECEFDCDPSEIDSLPANTANDATKNHYALCGKWDKRKPSPRKAKGGR